MDTGAPCSRRLAIATPGIRIVVVQEPRGGGAAVLDSALFVQIDSGDVDGVAVGSVEPAPPPVDGVVDRYCVGSGELVSARLLDRDASDHSLGRSLSGRGETEDGRGCRCERDDEELDLVHENLLGRIVPQHCKKKYSIRSQ